MTTLPQTLGPDGTPDGGDFNNGTGGPGVYARNPGSNGHATGRMPPVSTLPALSGPLSVPVSAGGQPGGGGGGQGAQLTGADVMRVLRENLWLIVLALIVSGVAGYALNEYLRRNFIAYTADAKLFLTDPEGFNPFNETGLTDRLRDNDDLDVRLQTQAARLKSEQLFDKLLTQRDNALKKSEWLRKVAGTGDGKIDPGRAKEALFDAFNAGPIRGTRLIDVEFTANDPIEARNILELIVNTRLEDQLTEAGRSSSQRIEDMKRVIREREADIQEVEREIRGFDSARAGANEAVASMAALEQQLRMVGTSVFNVEQERDAFASQLQAAQDAVALGQFPAGVEAMVAQNPEVAQLRQSITNTDTELDMRSNELGEQHRFVRALQNQLGVLSQRLRDREDEVRATSSQDIIGQLQGLVEQRKAMLAGLEDEYRRLDEELQRVSRASKELALAQDRKELLSREISDMGNALSNAETEANVRRQSLAQLTVVDAPAKPSSPSFPKLPLTVGGCVLLGVGLAVGFAFLREVLDTSVKSPRDVAKIGAMNVLGVIPDEDHDPEATAADNPLELTIAAAPQSMTAEQFRTLRGRLAQVTPLESTRTILVTSPQPGDGKTTVACNLAAGLALNGRRVLLVDANLRRPGVHKVFGLDNDRGLTTALQDADAFESCVRDAEQVPNLSVLPAGPRVPNATEMIEGGNFTDVLDRALEDYDLVVFDSGPVLFVSETAALAPQVDGVVSVVRARRSSRGLLGRLRETLRGLNVEHLGVVLNGVRGRAGGYYNRNIKTYYAYQK